MVDDASGRGRPVFGLGTRIHHAPVGRSNRGDYGTGLKEFGEGQKTDKKETVPVGVDVEPVKEGMQGVGRSHSICEDIVGSGYPPVWAIEIMTILTNVVKAKQAVANLWPTGPASHTLAPLALAWDVAYAAAEADSELAALPRISESEAAAFYPASASSLDVRSSS